MDIPIPATIPSPEYIYYKEYILKKEASRIWTAYYAVLCDRYLVFNRKDPESTKFLENNCTIVELQSQAIVAYSPKTCYRFPFYIKTGKLTYHFKCETNLQRYRWVCALRLAIARKRPEPPPKFIPTRYSRGKLAKKEDKLSLQAVKSAATTRGQHPAHAVRVNGHLNGSCTRSSENLADSEEENELYHSSHAVRLHKNSDSLLLENKAADKDERQNNNSVLFLQKKRSSSLVDNDLEIVDLDGSGHFGTHDFHNDQNNVRRGSKVSNSSQTRKKVWINDRPTDMEEDFNDRCRQHNSDAVKKMDSVEMDDTGQTDIHMPYRIYPDNVKSHSWTSLGIIQKDPVTRRENSAPPATRRERIMNRKNLVEKFQKIAD